MPSYSSGDWFFNCNDIFLVSNGEKFASFSLTLRQAGWVLLGKNTGAAVSIPSGPPLTPAEWNSGANAWEWYRDPAGGRDLTLQRGASNQSVRMYLGQRGVPFTGGDTTNPPTAAATRFQIIGTGDGFATTWWSSTVNSEVIDIGAKSTFSGPHGEVFPFWMRARTIGGPTGSSMLLGAVWSPAGAADAEPWVNSQGIAQISNNNRTWFRAGEVDQARDFSMPGINLGQWSGVNPYNARDDLSPFWFLRTASTPLQRKGQLLDILGSDPIRAFGDTIELGGPLAYFNHAGNANGALTPWPAGIAPIGL